MFLVGDMGIDLSTANTLVYLKGKGRSSERTPPGSGYWSGSNKVLAVGEEAKANDRGHPAT